MRRLIIAVERYWKRALLALGVTGLADLLREFAKHILLVQVYERLGIFGQWLFNYPFAILTLGLIGILLTLAVIAIKEADRPEFSAILDPQFKPYTKERISRTWTVGFSLGVVVCVSVVGYGAYDYYLAKGSRQTKEISIISPEPAGASRKAATRGQIEVVDQFGVGLRGAEILLIKENSTHQPKIVTDESGVAEIGSIPENETMSVFCADEGFSSYYEHLYDFKKPLIIKMTKRHDGGSTIFVEDSGYIPGLDGRLNPIRDSLNRTYLYADNIAIEGGAPQPVTFTTGRPLRVEDAQRHAFEIIIVAIVGRSSLIEYRRASHH